MNTKEAASLFLSQYGHNTAKTYSQGIDNFLSGLPDKDLNDITVEDVVEWRRRLVASSASTATSATYWDGARSFFDWSKRAGYISGVDPFSVVRRPIRVRDQQRKAATPDQVRLLIAHSTTSRESALIVLLAHGLRIQEAVNARPSDIMEVTSQEKYLRVLGKGQKERMVPLLNWATAILDQCAEGVTPFVHTNGQPLSSRQAQSIFQSLCKKAGISGISPHSMRHGYATRLLRAGVNLAVVSKVLGHESIKTTEIYLHLGTEDIGVARDLDPLTPSSVIPYERKVTLGVGDDFLKDFMQWGNRLTRIRTEEDEDGQRLVTYRVDKLGEA